MSAGDSGAMPAIDSGACRPGRQGGVTVVDVKPGVN